MNRSEQIKWVVGWLIVLAVAVAAGLLIRARRQAAVSIDPQTGELGTSFRYDVSALRRTDPRLRIGEEEPSIKSPVVDPHAIAVDESDRLYVGGEQAVAVLDRRQGAPAVAFAVDGPVRCLAVDQNGRIYVGHADHVAVCTAQGQPVARWPSLGADAVLTSIAVAGTNVFVADAGQRRVWRLDTQGNVLGRIDGKTGEGGGFVIPSPCFDLAIGPGNELWVVDPGRHALVCFSFDGRRQSQWIRSGTEPEGFCGCCNPAHIAIRPDGSFVTSEKGLVRVKVHAVKGDLLGVVAGPEQFAEDQLGLDLAVDSEGCILVLDPGQGRIRRFKVTK